MRPTKPWRRLCAALEKGAAMSAHPHGSSKPHQRRESGISLADGVEDLAVLAMCVTAVVIVAGILALLIIV
jgi:hypothetical protein